MFRKTIFTLFLVAMITTACGGKANLTSEKDQNSTSVSGVSQSKNSTEKGDVSTTSPDKTQNDNKEKNADAVKSSGLLLGLEVGGKNYKTMYITHKNNRVTLEKEGSGLLVPRNDGFWILKVKNIMKNDTYKNIDFAINYDFIDTNKADKGGSPDFNIEAGKLAKTYSYDETPGTEGKKQYSLDFSSEIKFVGTNYLTVFDTNSGYTGGAHPFLGNSLTTYSLDDLNKANIKDSQSLLNRISPESSDKFSKMPIAISKMYKSEGTKVLKESGKKYLLLHPESQEKLSPEVYGETEWGIIRAKGSWNVQGMLGYSSEAARGNYALFDTSLKAPKEIVSHDTLVPEWNVIKNKIPQAEDGFTSPGKDLLVILASKKLMFYENAQFGLLDKPIFELNLEEKESPKIVMIQWCEGNYIDRWKTEAEKYLKKN